MLYALLEQLNGEGQQLQLFVLENLSVLTVSCLKLTQPDIEVSAAAVF